MKKYRIASLMLILLILTIYTVPAAYSAEKGTVYSEIIKSVKKDDSISIPIKIKNAEALMGFKLRFTPSGNELKVRNVQSGELTQNGFLNHNADINEASFDVVWSGTEAIGNDGTICILNAECLEDFKDFSFQVTYSQQDTFDENFEDTELVCEAVTIQGTLTKSNEITNQILEKNDEEKVVSSINSVLKKLDLKTPDDVTKEKTEEFIQSVSNAVIGFDDVTVDLSNEEKLDVVKEIYNIHYEDETVPSVTEPIQDTPKNNFTFYIVIGVAVAVAFVVILLIIRRKKNEKSNS